MMSDIDDIDRTILALLQENGRTPYAELGKAVGLAVSSVNERVKKLNERGVIEGVHAAVSASALRLDLLAFVFVGWNDPATEEQFLARVASEPAILECHHVTGTWNYLLKVRTHTTRDLEAFLGGIVKAVPGVLRTETLIALSSPKETGHLPLVPPTEHARKAGR
ncbi:Lrp/AsnC family transcriptional regulator [Mesorhizobium ephedrae]|jgi:Lrp/AsnC family leucine-responsive transcriptional regulator|uniref:Lrp/AsnC family transcriptional regulator n=2 Tax=Kumtagia ephedrae TaxID=2116701 RepID=A0A2P7S6G0_9HYPH|nr:Lrp/AsnC family transcriptional regulator [Mesorhizobium ephedrae]